MYVGTCVINLDLDLNLNKMKFKGITLYIRYVPIILVPPESTCSVPWKAKEVVVVVVVVVISVMYCVRFVRYMSL